MAYFTPQEASASTITRCEAKFADTGMTNHLYYVFGVKDAEGFSYDWKNFDLEPSADNALIKDSIMNSLTTSVTKKVNKPEATMDDESIIGENP